MGLFTSKKNLCPICGSPTPRLFATKVEDMPICKECDSKIDIPQETVQAMTVDGFRQYLAFYDENAALRARFKKEYSFDVKGWSTELRIDFTHGLFRLTDQEGAIAYEKSCIRSFRILEDNYALYEGDASGLRCRTSKAPDYLNGLQPVYNEYLRERQEYERMKALTDALDKDGNSSTRRTIPEPRFNATKPVQQYRIVITMDHPYRKEFQGDLESPDFGFITPDLTETIRKYNDLLTSLDGLARNLMMLFAPNAPVQRSGSAGAQPVRTAPVVPTAAPASAAPTDAVTEIQRYKALMDQGIITGEEFEAKKRQLLGI